MSRFLLMLLSYGLWVIEHWHLWKLGRAARIALVVAGFIVVFGTYFSLSAYYLDHGRMNADEGYYALAARNVIDGKIPYRDFAYTQMPLLPYVNGIAMSIFGWGLTAQRTINMFWAAFGILGIILALRHRLGSWEPGLVAGFTVAASPYWGEFQAMGKTHGAAGMFMALTTAAMLMRWPIYRKTIAVALLGTVASGCRLSLGPVVAIFVIGLMFETKHWKQRLIVPSIAGGIAAIGLLPFFLMAPKSMKFFVWDYHMASVFVRRSLAQAVEWIHIAPAALLLLFAAWSGIALLVRKRMWTEISLIFGTFLGVSLPMIPISAYGSYIVPVVLSAAVAGVAAIWGTGLMQGFAFRHVIWIVPLLALFHPMPKTASGLKSNGQKIEAITNFVGDAIHFDLQPEGKRTSKSVESCAKFVRDHVAQGPILTPLPIVAIEAKRQVMPGTDMGMFTAMGPEDRERAKKLNLVTLYELIDMVNNHEPAAIVKLKGSINWNFKWKNPTLKRQPKGLYSKFEQAMKSKYYRAHSVGNLEVLLPKKP